MIKKNFKSILTASRKERKQNMGIDLKIPEGLENVFSKPYSLPLEQQIRDEIKTYMEEYDKFDLSEYVDLFENKTYAMFKYNLSFRPLP